MGPILLSNSGPNKKKKELLDRLGDIMQIGLSSFFLVLICLALASVS